MALSAKLEGVATDDSTFANDDSSDEALIRLAHKRFELAVEAESENRKNEIDDLKFMAGYQWPLDIQNQRQQDARPCLTINRIPQFVRQITNDQRQNRPSIKVNPVDDQADIDTAKVFQGIIRHIEYASHADNAYDTAFEYAVKSGVGYFRIITEFRGDQEFQQDIRIKRIKNRFSVYVDPNFQEPDGSDMEWASIFDDISHDEYKALFPDSKLASLHDWASLGETRPGWVTETTVRVSEHYYKTYEMVDLVLLSDGSVHEKDKLPKKFNEGVKVKSERRALVPRVKWIKHNAIEILERTDIPGRYIPIIPVIGDEENVDGRRSFSGIIRNAKDPQRMLNYWASSQAETIALAPKAPFIGAEGQFEGHEVEWKTANTKNHAYLEYKPTTIAGQQAPPPQRNMIEPPVQAITQALVQAGQDLKDTTGIYDASLGNRSNESSGLAIQRRNIQAQTTNFHFIDNLTRSLRHAGRILVSWIPKVYDTPQVVRMIAEDGEVSMVAINQIFQEGGVEKSHFLDAGSYDVTIETGPSFATKRQEAVASMLDLSRAAPQLMQVAGDLMVRNMDWPGAQEIADRLKKMLPPQLQTDDKNQQPVPPQVQAQMKQMQMLIQQLTEHLNAQTEIIKNKKLELESKERIALWNNQAQLGEAFMKADAADAQLVYKSEVDLINQRLAMAQDQINQVFNQSGGQPAATPEQQPPTGGPSPGQPMGS